MASLHWGYIKNILLSQTPVWFLIKRIAIRAFALRAQHYTAIWQQFAQCILKGYVKERPIMRTETHHNNVPILLWGLSLVYPPSEQKWRLKLTCWRPLPQLCCVLAGIINTWLHTNTHKQMLSAMSRRFKLIPPHIWASCDAHNLSHQFFTFIYPSAVLLPFAQAKMQGIQILQSKSPLFLLRFIQCRLFPRTLMAINRKITIQWCKQFSSAVKQF